MGTALINEDVLDILNRSHVEENRLYLPDEQLDRPLYIATNKVIDAIGGKWKGGKVKAHLFADDVDVEAMLASVLQTGMMPDKNPLAYWPTPPDIALIACQYAELNESKSGDRWLEPSCGEGHLLKVMDTHKRNEAISIDAIEIDERRSQLAANLNIARVLERDFLVWSSCAESNPALQYDRIVMNPPFSLKGNLLVYVDHILAAWRLLKPGGILVSIVPSGITFSSKNKIKSLKETIDQHYLIKLPDNSFKESGTAVNTMLFKARNNP